MRQENSHESFDEIDQQEDTLPETAQAGMHNPRRRRARKSIEEMLEERELKKRISDIFDEED